MIGTQIAFEGYALGESRVLGVYTPDQAAAEVTYRGLLALRHNSQDTADIAVSDGRGVNVSDIDLSDADPAGAAEAAGTDGRFASGQVRYGRARNGVARLVAAEVEEGADLAEAVALAALRPGFVHTAVILGPKELIGLRHPEEPRPLSLGNLPGWGAVLASGRHAITAVGAEFSRDLEPGELIRINEKGLRTSYMPLGR